MRVANICTVNKALSVELARGCEYLSTLKGAQGENQGIESHLRFEADTLTRKPLAQTMHRVVQESAAKGLVAPGSGKMLGFKPF